MHAEGQHVRSASDPVAGLRSVCVAQAFGGRSKHALRQVQAHHTGAFRGKESRIAPRPATQVQDTASGPDGIQDQRSDDRLVQPVDGSASS